MHEGSLVWDCPLNLFSLAQLWGSWCQKLLQGYLWKHVAGAPNLVQKPRRALLPGPETL